MAHTKSALKRRRQSDRQQAANRAGKSLMKKSQKALLTAVEKKDKAAIDTSLRAYHGVLDKLSKRGIIPRNQAIRKKTRANATARTVAA